MSLVGVLCRLCYWGHLLTTAEPTKELQLVGQIKEYTLWTWCLVAMQFLPQEKIAWHRRCAPFALLTLKMFAWNDYLKPAEVKTCKKKEVCKTKEQFGKHTRSTQQKMWKRQKTKNSFQERETKQKSFETQQKKNKVWRKTKHTPNEDQI